MLLVSLTYAVGSWWGDKLLWALGLPPYRTANDLWAHGLLSIGRQELPAAPAVCLSLAAAYRYGWSRRLGLTGSRNFRTLAASALVSAGISLVLDGVGLWPWRWKENPRSNLLFVGTLLTGHQWAGLGVWCVSLVVVLPVLEELVFRCALLQLLLRSIGSVHWAVWLGAGIFAMAHLGPGAALSQPSLLNVFWAFWFGIAVGYATVRSSNRLSIAVGAHCGRAFIELLSLLVTAPRVKITGA